MLFHDTAPDPLPKEDGSHSTFSQNVLQYRRRACRANIDTRKEDSSIGRAMGSAYDSLVGALQDIHRRLVENPWYGKDIFDGRWHMDTQGPQGMQGMDRDYDTRHAFYGWDKQNPSQDQGKEKSQDQGNDESQGLSYSRGR
jgi:hypothetical protein